VVNRHRSRHDKSRATLVTMIIDCHCHAGKGDIMTAPWNMDAPIVPYLRRARATGHSKSIVHYGGRVADLPNTARENLVSLWARHR
jgi:hypothetical protein